MTARFSDSGASVHDFADEFLVVCPKCSGCALVEKSAAPAGLPRGVCKACGWSTTAETSSYAVQNDARDWYFHLPLWLRTRCRNEELWARNAEHLAFLEAYVQAGLRERPELDTTSFYYRNRGLASRLPAWMKSGKNREAVTAALSRLRELLRDAP